MDIKAKIEEQLVQPVTRKQFLARTGGVALSLIGITAVLHSLQKTRPQSGGAALQSYGSGTYGGKDRA